MIQKIIKVGNSAAILLPKATLIAQGLKIGSTIHFTIETPKKPVKTVVDKEVYAVATDLLKRYLPAFKKLAKPHDQISLN
ncbi:MAG: hypothetical protein AAB542_04600 [Patescibacteria group bacterium]